MNDPRSESEASDTSNRASLASSPSSWSIGLVCADSADIVRCVAELAVADLSGIRLFVHTDTVVPDSCSHLPVTVLDDRFPPRAAERLVVAELLMRTPMADAFLFITSNAETRGIDHWRDRVNELLTSSTQRSLYVDSRETPKLHVLSTESAKAFLGDFEGLPASLLQTVSQDACGTALIDWASRTETSVVVIPLAADSSSPSEDSACNDATSVERVSATNERIRVSGASVSIVVPSWNCADYLSACLNSLLRQTVAAEIIVVDDASTDDTVGVLKTFGDRITVVRHSSQRGANAARNTGIAAASGNFIAFADADNEYAGRWIELLLNAILAEPNAAIAYCGYAKQASDGSRVVNHCAPWDLDTLWFGNYIDMSSVVRRSAIPTEGLHEGFRPFDDWRLWLKLAQHGWRGVWVPEELFVKHVRDASKTEQSMANPSGRGRDIAHVRREFAGLVGLDKPVSVVIPASGCEDLTARCLAHLGEFCGVPFNVIYVDNGSPVATLDSVVHAANEAGISLRIIRNLENRGFTHAVNQGIEAAGDADVLILNNDCFIGPGCVENLARELRFDDRVAAAGPLTCDDGKQSLKREERQRLLQLPDDILEELGDPVRVSFRLSQRLRSVSEPVLSFFCALLKREVLTQYGGLDPQFASGLAADDEWCFRVRNHGCEVRVVLNAYAAHLHRSSFERLEIDRDSLQQDAQELLHRVLAAGQSSPD
jgi:GT2 family glycosyltransferase